LYRGETVLLEIFKEKECKENNKLIRNNDCIRKNGNDIKIKCVGKVNDKFLGKRKQAMYESMLLGKKNLIIKM
jgi:hypothetical protein